MEKKLYNISSGLKAAKKRKDITQEKLAKLMDVHPKTVMNWEQGLSNPDLETLVTLAEKLDCDVDFLLGRLRERTHDIHYVHEQTGLSEKAIEQIGSPWTIDDGLTVEKVGSPVALSLSHLIESEGFDDFISAYMVFLTAVDRLKKSVKPTESHTVIQTDEVTLRIDEVARFYMQNVLQTMTILCENEYRASYEKYLENSRHGSEDHKDGRNE